MKSVFECIGCGHQHSKYETFSCLHLPVAKPKKPHPDDKDFEKVLRKEYFGSTKTTIDCSYCKKKTDYLKQDNIDKCPPCLIVMLRRYKMKDDVTFQKIQTNMVYPFSMTLEGCQYKLKSVICHEGSLCHGHYFV